MWPSLVALALLAQDVAVPKVHQDKDLIITASRLEEESKDAASSHTLLKAADLQRAQQRFVLDALREVPALDVVAVGSFGATTSVFVRGANSEQTLLLIDGIEMHDAASGGRAFDFAHLTTDHVEQIEVIRGPQSVLYGSDALGGVIHVRTPRGRGEPRLRLTAEGGSFATYRGLFSLGGGNERVHYSLGGSRVQTAGFSAADDELPGNSERDGYRNATLSARVGVTPVEWFQVDVVARTVEARGELDNGGGANQDDPNHATEFGQTAFKIEPRLLLFDGAWEQTLAFKLTDVERNTDNLPDSASIEQVFSSFDSRIVDVDWQHTFRIHPADVLIVGGEYEEDSASSSFFSDGVFGPFSSVDRKRTAWTRGAYVQNRLELAEVFTGTAGIRVDRHERFGTEGTWRLAGALRIPGSGTKLRGTAGTGFKAPSLFQLHSSFGNLGLDPEESLGWDAGVDQELWGEAAVLSATYFRNEFEDLIDFDFVTSTFVNIGRAETEGVEAALRLQPAGILLVTLSYTLTEAEDKDVEEKLLRRPSHKGGIRATLLPSDGWSATLAAVYVGDRKDVDFSTFPSRRVTLDDYWLGSLALGYRPLKELEIFARVENLFDQDYEPAVGFGAAPAAGYVGASLSF